MKIAAVSSQAKGGTDAILMALAARLEAEGRTLVGIVKDESHASRYANGCDMKVRVMPGGPVIQITQDLGAGSDACRLDPGAIAEAVARVENGPLEGADLFLLNKFGPEEAEGRGFCAVIGRALEQGVPVLVGVSPANREAFERFSGGLAEALPDDLEALVAWCGAAEPATTE